MRTTQHPISKAKFENCLSDENKQLCDSLTFFYSNLYVLLQNKVNIILLIITSCGCNRLLNYKGPCETRKIIFLTQV